MSSERARPEPPERVRVDVKTSTTLNPAERLRGIEMRLALDTLPAIQSLRDLVRAENECTRCPLYKDATQAVPGEGRKHAHLMLVGEQPGDKEDLAGKPFVGPAGRILDQALAEARIPRADACSTDPSPSPKCTGRNCILPMAQPPSSPSIHHSCCGSRTRPTRHGSIAISSPISARRRKFLPGRRLENRFHRAA